MRRLPLLLRRRGGGISVSLMAMAISLMAMAISLMAMAISLMAMAIAAATVSAAFAPGVAAAAVHRTYYVAIGASESVGFQPTPGDVHGTRTGHGYADDLTAIEHRRWPGLHLVAFGCPGITAQAALRGGGPCRYAAGSELRQAVAFVRHHRGTTVLATVDLGFNDVWPCLAHDVVDQACVTTALARVGRAVPAILRDVRRAGGPRLHIVGVLHNDPYLGDYLHGRSGRHFAEASMGAIDGLNRTLASAYRAAGALSADVPAAFATGNRRLVDLPGHGKVPLEVARICTMSWMCAPPPTGANIHPNASGYRAMAQELAASLAGTLGHLRAPAGRPPLPHVAT